MIEPTEGWRKLYNVELHDLYSSQRKIKMLSSRRMNFAGNVAKARRKENARKGVSGWMILRWIS
jgi:hypothetical protein